MKLNLGCGFNKLKGFINIDNSLVCGPDQLVDLEQIPWPFEDNCAEVVYMSHILEHLGESTKVYLDIIKELYRICKAGAKIEIRAPYPRHNSFIYDPTHVRPITAAGMSMFSKAQNLEWQKQEERFTPLALMLDVDFEVISSTENLDEPWNSRYREGKIGKEDILHAMRSYNNVIIETIIIMRAVK